MSMLALVAASKTSSTPSTRKAEHSLYALAPMAAAMRSPSSLVTHLLGTSGLCSRFSGRRSTLQPTRITGIIGPQIALTSVIHYSKMFSKDKRSREEKRYTFVVTFSKESGVSIAKAMRMTWDLEYDIGRKPCEIG